MLELRHQLRHLHITSGQLFYAMDADRSNDITLREFKRGLAMVGIRPIPSDHEMRQLFASYDLDGDGSCRDRPPALGFRPPCELPSAGLPWLVSLGVGQLRAMTATPPDRERGATCDACAPEE